VSERILRGALGAALLLVLAACSEQVTGSIGCPALCADQSATLRDTTLTGAVVLDSTLVGYPQLGETRDITLVSQGDTADVRLVVRFDTLPNTYRPTGATVDSAITRVDSATLIFVVDTAFTKPRVPVTVDAFDVDTTANDTVTASLVPLFRADRLLGSATYQPADIKDTLRLPLDNATLLRKSASGQHLRIGLRVRSTQSVKLRVAGSAFEPRVRFRVSADSTVRPDTVTLLSRTPADQPAIAANLVMFPVVVSGALPAPSSGLLTVGGIAGARSYLRFDIPSIVLDSVQVIRASLVLTQVAPRSAGDNADTLTLGTFPVLASPLVTDLRAAMNFLGVGSIYHVDSLRARPLDARERSIEMVNLVRLWRSVGTSNTTRAVVLRANEEQSSAGELSFVSSEGPLAQRPRLRLTYVPRRGFGIP
jgi:hypothetical protein